MQSNFSHVLFDLLSGSILDDTSHRHIILHYDDVILHERRSFYINGNYNIDVVHSYV
jgi:hypothetical protein